MKYKVWEKDTDDEPYDWSVLEQFDPLELKYVAGEIALGKSRWKHERDCECESYDFIVKFDTGETFNVHTYVMMEPTFHVGHIQKKSTT